MPLSWDLFISREKLAGVIADLEGKRDNLKRIVNEEVRKVIKQEFPRIQYCKIERQHREEIIRIQDTLYSEFFEGINRRLRFFYSVRQDNAQAS